MPASRAPAPASAIAAFMNSSGMWNYHVCADIRAVR
jgi:hypothetical protein